ncbi:DUF6268 family outer membrane beta-barrel protein [Planctomicrobium piriforme]|nr:DUF6268 family outer membrane beta-barrel protein [Planctomicrobium piriforme]
MRGWFLIVCLLCWNSNVRADALNEFPSAAANSTPVPWAIESLTKDNAVQAAAFPGGDDVVSVPEDDLSGAAPEALDPPKRAERVSVSTVETSAEPEIDLRPPDFPLDGLWNEVEPSWLNEMIDDHILLWQNVTDSMTTVPRGGTDFGITTLGIKFDLTGNHGPIWLAGYFGWNFLSGPSTAAVPAQTYDLGVELNYSKQLNELWGMCLTVSPLFATDFANNSSDGFRLTAGGLFTFQADDVTRLVAGLSYLDRPDLPFLPIAGLRWAVTDNVEMDILVPTPKLAWRFDQNEDREAWLYTAGEVGGGSWAVERENQLNDRMGYRDLRWVCGVESRQVSGSRRVLEAGYVFDRKISFQRGPGDERPGSTFVVRWGRLY